MATKKPTPEELQAAALQAASGLGDTLSSWWDTLDEGFRSAYAIGSPSPEEAATAATAPKTAVQAVQKYEQKTAAGRQIESILEAANIDPNSPLTKILIDAMGDTPEAQLAILNGPGADLTLQGWLQTNPEASLIRPTPYTQALEQNAFSPTIATLPPRGPGPWSTAPPYIPKGDYEYSDSTGAMRFANGTIVTADGGIIYDPTQEAPGSPQWLRKVSETWGPQEIQREKAKLVASGYLSKDDAKGDGFTVEFRQALSTYWRNYYVAGGKPIDSAKAADGNQLPPLMDYKDFQSQITNDMRDQLRRIFGTEPTEEQVRAQAQYVMRTAADLQKTFRKKEYGSYSSQALTEATERGIGALETSPYAQDVMENTKLADSLQNAAYVSRSLLT
jgi:hypothetical protein